MEKIIQRNTFKPTEDEDFCAYLRDKVQEGWQICKFNPWFITFKKGEKTDKYYIILCNTGLTTEKEHLSEYQALGLELVASCGDRYLFSADTPFSAELKKDAHAKLKKFCFSTLRTQYVLLFPIIMPIGKIIYYEIAYREFHSFFDETKNCVLVAIVLALFAGLLVYNIRETKRYLKLKRNIMQLDGEEC